MDTATDHFRSSNGSGFGMWSKRNALAADFKTFVADVEQLLKNGSELSGEGLAAVGRALEAKIEQARHRIDDATGTTAQRLVRVREAAGGYVRERPLASVSATAVAGIAVGFLAALLIMRR